MKIGRNEPCPCGSGKKYKKCCLPKAEAKVFSYRRISNTYNALLEKLLYFADDKLGQEGMGVAVDEFLLWEGDEREPPEGLELLFAPWALFTWYLYEEDFQEIDEDVPLPPDTTIAEWYVQNYGHKLDSLEQKILKAVARVPFSFYEVLDVTPGKEIRFNDLLTGQIRTVSEHSATNYLELGDIVFCSIAKIDEVEMLLGTSPIKFPLSWKTHVNDLRAYISNGYATITDDVLLEYDVEIRDLFLQMYDAAITPPAICNTDGDPFEPRTLHFGIENPQKAFEALHHLCVTDSRDELLQKAKQDMFGKLVEVEIPWNRLESGEKTFHSNTFLGSIKIKGKKMSVEVNSEERAKRVKEMITNALGDGVKHKTTTRHPIDLSGDDTQAEDALDFHNTMVQDPNVRAELEKHFINHWTGWIDTPLPALGDKTPREAVATPDGRDKVEALLESVRSGMDRMQGLELQEKGIELAKKELGL